VPFVSRKKYSARVRTGTPLAARRARLSGVP
jgi:hypothetical protein